MSITSRISKFWDERAGRSETAKVIDYLGDLGCLVSAPYAMEKTGHVVAAATWRWAKVYAASIAAYAAASILGSEQGDSSGLLGSKADFWGSVGFLCLAGIHVSGRVSAFLGKKLGRGMLDEAEALGGNLTEDMKKSPEAQEMLFELIWEEVRSRRHFDSLDSKRESAEILANRQDIDMLVSGCDEVRKWDFERKERAEGILRRAGKTREGFMLSMRYAVEASEPPVVLENNAGIPFVNLVKDVLDGGFLHSTDRKVDEHFREPGLRKALEYFRCKRRARKGTGFSLGSSLWFTLICHGISWRSVKASREYSDTFGMAQTLKIGDLLWPNPDSDRVIIQNLGNEKGNEAVLKLNELRHSIYSRVFHPDYERALGIYLRAKGAQFLSASDFLMECDPDYVLGKCLDLRTKYCCGNSRNIRKNDIEKRKRRIKEIDKLIESSFSELKSKDPMGFRALRASVYTGRTKLSDVYPESTAVEQVLRSKKDYEQHSCRLRLHHAFALFDIKLFEHYAGKVLCT